MTCPVCDKHTIYKTKCNHCGASSADIKLANAYKKTTQEIMRENKLSTMEKLLVSRVKEIFMRYCSDYPNIKNARTMEQLEAIEITLDTFKKITH